MHPRPNAAAHGASLIVKLSIASALLLTSLSQAGEITWLSLHPSGAEESEVAAAVGTLQGGFAIFSGVRHAGFWDSLASTFVDLDPHAADDSKVLGMALGQQVGYYRATTGKKPHAALWSSTEGSRVDLHPTGAKESKALATTGAMQGGYAKYAKFGNVKHAMLWYGAADSFVDLDPHAAGDSEVLGMAPGEQVGYYSADVEGDKKDGKKHLKKHAALWSGTEGSRIDLNPAGASESKARATTGSVQGGYAKFGEVKHAGLWYGTAGSFVDLDPTASDDSEVMAVVGMYQAGYRTVGGKEHAGYWTGTADSFVDLHSVLDVAFQESKATAIALNGSTLLISGFAKHANGDAEAILWTLTMPEPAGWALWSALGSLLFIACRRMVRTHASAPAPGGRVPRKPDRRPRMGGVPRFLNPGV